MGCDGLRCYVLSTYLDKGSDIVLEEALLVQQSHDSIGLLVQHISRVLNNRVEAVRTDLTNQTRSGE